MLFCSDISKFLLPNVCGDEEEGIDRLVVASNESELRAATSNVQFPLFPPPPAIVGIIECLSSPIPAPGVGLLYTRCIPPYSACRGFVGDWSEI